MGDSSSEIEVLPWGILDNFPKSRDDHKKQESVEFSGKVG